MVSDTLGFARSAPSLQFIRILQFALLTLVLVVISPSGVDAAGIALVQHASSDAGTTSTTVLAFPTTNTAGNWIGVCIRAGAVNESFTVVDSKGNVYRKAIQFTETGDGNSIGIYYAENIAGGADAVRVSDTASATLRIAILEYSGVATSGSLDAVAVNQGQSTTPNSGATGATTANGDLLLGAIFSANSATFTAGAGYTIVESVPAEPNTKLIAESEIQAVGGPATASATLAESDYWAAGVAAFRPAGNGGTSPSFTSTSSTTFTAGAVGTFTVSATGTPSLTETGTLPSGITFTDNGNGTATLAGTTATAGSYAITITAHNASGTATQAFTLTVGSASTSSLGFVQVNYATPQGTASKVTVTYSQAQTAGNLNAVVIGWSDSTAQITSVTDSRGNAYALAVGPTVQSGTATQAIYYAKYIAAAAANGNTVSVTFNSPANFPDMRIAEYSGIDPVNPIDTVAAAQGSGSSSNSGSVSTGNANDLLLGANLVQQLTMGPGSGYTGRVITAPDRDILEDQIVTTAGSHSATAVVSSGDWIMHMVAFRAASGGAGTPPSITSADSTTFTVTVAGTFTVTATGTPTSSLSEAGALPSGVTFKDNGNGTATLSGAPAAGTAGSYSFSITAQNGAGTSASQSFTLAVNQAPAITSANNATFTVTAAGAFTTTATGMPTPSLTETGALPSGVTFKDNGNGTATLSGMPGSGTAGTYMLAIKAHNGVGADASQTFSLTVNQGLTITSASGTTFTAGAAGTFTVTTTGTPAPSLTETGALPGGVTFVNNGNGTATLVGLPIAAGSYPITITAHNGVSADATQSFTLTVNQALAITSASSTTFTAGAVGTFTVSATGTPTPSLTETGTPPSGITFTDNGNGTATLAGTTATAGSYAITITAHNASGTATQAFTLTVGSALTSSLGFVQVNYATPQGTASNVTVTYSQAQTAGNLNAVVIGWSDSTAQITSVTDSRGNAYALAVGPTVQSGTQTLAIYYAKNIAAAAANSNTVTVAFGQAAASPDVRIAEYSGIDPTTPVDVVAAAQGSGTSSNSGSVTTGNASDLLVGANLVQTLTTRPGSGYTSRVITTPDGNILEDSMVTTTGSYSATAQVSPSGKWIMQMVAFRAAGSGVGTSLSITSVSPSSGPVGTPVTITGTNFGATQGAISFNGTPATPTSWSATSIVAPVPAGATTGNVVVTVGGQASNGFSFTVTVTSTGEPTLIQHVSCPNSRNTGNPQSSTPEYVCPLPEPSQAGNALLVGVVSYNAGAFTLSDDQSNAWTLVDSVVDSNSAYVAIYLATNVAAGTRFITLHRTTSNADDVAMSASEYYNVATSSAVDASNCNGSTGSSSTTIATGNITTTLSGDLLWQWAVNTGGGGTLPNSVSSFAVGSQPSISWQFNGTDLYDGDAVQAGIHNAAAAINPTFTSGSSEEFSSCVVALKAASAGSAPTNAFRIIHMLHQQVPASGANPWPMQFPSSGNLIVLSDVSGGSAISSISSSPSNTWSSTGSAAGSESTTALSQIYYAANATSSNAMTLSVTRSGTTTNDTFMMYDFTGAASSPFDVDSGGQTGSQTSVVGSFTTCRSCLTPTGASAGNEVIVGNMGINWCTATASSAPSGSLFDAATDTGNSVNGPQSVDQNNGWFHYYTSATNALTATWAMSCGGAAEGGWSGRLAAFKPSN